MQAHISATSVLMMQPQLKRLRASALFLELAFTSKNTQRVHSCACTLWLLFHSNQKFVHTACMDMKLKYQWGHRSEVWCPISRRLCSKWWFEGGRAA